MILPFAVFAQIDLDSLWGVWSNPNEADTNRLEAISDFSWHGYVFSQPDSAYYFAQMQYDYAMEKGLKSYMADALKTQGESFRVKGEYSKAMDFHMRSLKIYEDLGSKKGIAGSLNSIGIIYDYQGNYAKAIDFYMRSLKINEKIGFKRGIANTLNNIGVLYFYQGEYAKAIEFYTRSSKIYEEIGNRRGIAHCLNNIGMIYEKQGEFEKAIDFYKQSIKILEELGDMQSVASTLINIGLVYKSQNQMAKAMDFCRRSLKIGEELEDKQGIAFSLNIIGIIFQERGEYAKALDYSSRALTLAQEIGALSEIRAAANNLWETNKELGKYKAALEMHQLYVKIKDSLESEENQKEIIRQELKFSYEKEALADSIKNAASQKVLDAQIEAQTAELQRERIQRFALYGGVLLLLLFGIFIFNRLRITRNQKQIIENQKLEVDQAYSQLGEKNAEIMDSINYAKRIQSAILPPTKLVKELLKDSFILYKPKDIVAGDFYWMERIEESVLFAAADCTGHGVPGAMVSVICNGGLNRSVREFGLSEPGKILDKTRELVIKEFEKSEDEVKDGMDIAICSLEGNTLKYAGANNPLWIIRNGKIMETKANKQPIGKYTNPEPFTTHSIKLEKGDSIYIFSDGFVDQFGGEKGKKFKPVNLRNLLLSIQDLTMEKQKESLEKAFTSWMGDFEQIDDVCFIGVRV